MEISFTLLNRHILVFNIKLTNPIIVSHVKNS